MNNKGLTLIELLATLLVLAIVATIFFTNITGIIKEKRNEANEYQENIIKEGKDQQSSLSVDVVSALPLWAEGYTEKVWCYRLYCWKFRHCEFHALSR